MRHYEVMGVAREQILREMNKLGPNGFHAETRWFVQYQYQSTNGRGGCAVSEVRTTLAGEILMPHWGRRDGASSDTIARWQRYEAALRAHEEGHFQNGREAAAAVARELRELPPAQDCAALDQAVQVRFNQVLERYKQKDREYDERTRHGRTQGATF